MAHSSSQPTDPLPRSLDLMAFRRQGEPLGGMVPLSSLPRVVAEEGEAGLRALADGVASGARLCSWSLDVADFVDEDEHTYPAVVLEVGCTLWLGCQRCGQPVALPVDAQRYLALASSEAQADEWTMAIEADVDAINATVPLDLRELIEDEILLALPFAPMHEQCGLPEHRADSPERQDATGQPAAAAPARGWEALAALRSGLRKNSETDPDPDSGSQPPA